MTKSLLVNLAGQLLAAIRLVHSRFSMQVWAAVGKSVGDDDGAGVSGVVGRLVGDCVGTGVGGEVGRLV